MVDKIKEKKKENNKYEIRMIQIKKLQEINKKLKLDNEKLSKENTALTNGFSKLKTLMVEHEYERIQREQEQEWFFEQLAKENDNLKRLLLINHDFTHDIGQRIEKLEQEDRKKELDKFRKAKLKEEADQRLQETSVEIRQLVNEPENEEFEKLELSDDEEREDFSPLSPSDQKSE